MLKRILAALVIMTVLAIVAPAVIATSGEVAPSVMGGPSDAPSLLPGQCLEGPNPPTAVSALLSRRNDEDLYRIRLTDGVSLSATTVGTAFELAPGVEPGAQPSNVVEDTQLFLFGSRGRGIYANDDSVHTLRANLPPFNRPPGPLTGGIYHLAISASNNDPVDASRRRIFESVPLFGVVGPRPAAGPLAGWTNTASARSFFPEPFEGRYTIVLQGAEFCTQFSSSSSSAVSERGG